MKIWNYEVLNINVNLKGDRIMVITDYLEFKKNNSITNFKVEDGKISMSLQLFNSFTGEKIIIEDVISMEEILKNKNHYEQVVTESQKIFEALKLILNDAQNYMLSSAVDEQIKETPNI